MDEKIRSAFVSDFKKLKTFWLDIALASPQYQQQFSVVLMKYTQHPIIPTLVTLRNAITGLQDIKWKTEVMFNYFSSYVLLVLGSYGLLRYLKTGQLESINQINETEHKILSCFPLEPAVLERPVVEISEDGQILLARQGSHQKITATKPSLPLVQ